MTLLFTLNCPSFLIYCLTGLMNPFLYDWSPISFFSLRFLLTPSQCKACPPLFRPQPHSQVLTHFSRLMPGAKAGNEATLYLFELSPARTILNGYDYTVYTNVKIKVKIILVYCYLSCFQHLTKKDCGVLSRWGTFVQHGCAQSSAILLD